jgi:hypothetical protein
MLTEAVPSGDRMHFHDVSFSGIHVKNVYHLHTFLEIAALKVTGRSGIYTHARLRMTGPA